MQRLRRSTPDLWAAGEETVRVGFVGLGSQGGAMARRIVEAGIPLTLWARRSASLEPYTDTEAQIARSLPDLGAASNVLCVCVVSDRDVDQVLRGPEGALVGMHPGGIVVIHSTTRPETCRDLQADFPALHVLDAPVSGGGHMAEAGRLLVMVGGDRAVLDECRAVFDTYANPLVHMGPLGTGQEAKLLNNVLFAAQLGLVADVFGIARERGLDLDALTVVLGAASGRSYALDVVARSAGRLEAIAGTAGPLLAKDVDILAELVLPADTGVIRAANTTLKGMGLSRIEIEEPE